MVYGQVCTLEIYAAVATHPFCSNTGKIHLLKISQNFIKNVKMLYQEYLISKFRTDHAGTKLIGLFHGQLIMNNVYNQ